MSVPTPANLLAFLQEHGFLTPPQVQQLRGGSDTKFADARVLARELVDRNWLTPYQANQLLMGRGADLLVGSYRIVDRLGEGGMGQVFKAHHVSMDRLVALKIIAKDRVSNPTAVARFYREVRAVAKLSHPNIVIAFEVNQVGQTPFLAMEYVEGIDLTKLIQQSGPLPIPRACDYIRQAATGLQHAHEKGLVHRDIKPGNLMVARPSPNEPPLIKILDFGLARFESESDHTTRLTQLGKVMGTVDYIAPEQAQNPRTADIRADIYSLGCTLFYLLTGKPPFAGEDAVEKIRARVLGEVPSVRESRPEVSPALERIVAKMMARTVEERYQTPGEVAKALEPHTQHEGEKRRVAKTIVDRSVAPQPISPTLIEPLVRSFTPPLPKPKAVASQKGEREPRAPKLKTSVWLSLVEVVAFGTVVLLVVIVGGIMLYANSRDSDSTKGPAIAGKDTNADKSKLAGPVGKTLPAKDPIGEIRRFIGHSADGDGVVDVAFSSNGRMAASGGDDSIVFLWDVESGKEIHRFEGHTGQVRCVCFTPDGLHVVSGGRDTTLRLWDVASGKEVRRFEGHTRHIEFYMAVTPDGQQILSGAGDIEMTIRIWDLNNGKELRRFYYGTNHESTGIANFSTDARRALMVGNSKLLRLWDVDKGTMLRLLDEQSRGGAFSPDGRFAVAFGLDKYLRLYDVESGKLIRRFQQGPAVVHNASFSPDGQRLLVCYVELDSAGLWDVRSGKEVHRIAGNPKGFGRITFSPDGRRALTAGRDGTVRLWGLPE